MTRVQQVRDSMVRDQIERRGVRDPAVLAAMRVLPRERFIPGGRAADAYDDRALPIDLGQTISQPYMVARMTELLEIAPGRRVLEIGTGSGYQAAVLAHLGVELFTIDRLSELRDRAESVLRALDLAERVRFRVGDGSLGWPAAAPFDGIIVTAALRERPRPLCDQLAEGGRLVAPIGGDRDQTLVRLTRRGNRLRSERYFDCRFVRLIGDAGWEG